jgi:selenide,water dikinase
MLDARTSDDAAVYRLSDELALVQSVDLITPIVDDPYAFGQIVAANALSDLYAKGARPLLALNVVGFPVKSLPLSALEEMLRGGADKLAEAGAYLAGGHSIDDDEPKYGMAVTGLVHPERVVTNAGARPGDALVLTKPLGTGIITTGIDRQLVAEETIERVVAVMSELNRAAAEAMLEVGAHACTDVTGFGLLGHLRELAVASGASAEVWLEKVPVLPEVWELVRQGAVPDGTRNNHRYLADHVAWEGLTHEEQLVLCDAQTSGGLLIAVAEERRTALLQALESAGVSAARIGEVVEGGAGRIRVRRS